MRESSLLFTRRQVIAGAGQATLALGVAAAIGPSAAAIAGDQVTLPFGNGERPLVKYPQKRPLIGLTQRPPQLETPFGVFDEGVITPNDAFFVRYHLGGAPPDGLDAATFQIAVKGTVATPLQLSVADLKSKFEPVEFIAVNQCSGNSRGLFNPRVAGGQLGNGAMGNASWKGVPLRAILDKAGVHGGAKQVTFNGADEPALPATPDFVKALDIDHARDGEVMVAFEMNGEDLPVLNGYPVRLVVPGYYGTYWVKHLNEITVIDSVLANFWMKTAYRIPDNTCACVAPGAKPAATVPIGKFDVRSFITNLADRAKVRAGESIPVKGIAFDGGYGIADVGLSADGGETWITTRLGKDLGKYSFREWQTEISLKPGDHELRVRAVNRIGQSQPMEPLWNPAGYMRNVVEAVHVTAG